MGIAEITPEKFSQRFTVAFIESQNDEWVIRFYTFLADQPYIWREGGRGRQSGLLRNKPFIRLGDGSHVAPFAANNVPNAYLPPAGETEFSIVKREICADDRAYEFVAKKLQLPKPDVVAEVLNKVLPRYQRTETVSPEQHTNDLRKIFEAMVTASGQSKTTLTAHLRETPFLRAKKTDGSEARYLNTATVYFRTPKLDAYFFGSGEDIWFLDETISAEEQFLLKGLDVADAPRRQSFRPQFDWQRLAELRRNGGCTSEVELTSFELEGLANCLNRICSLPFAEATSLVCIIWEFLADQAPTSASSYSGVPNFSLGIYRWFYYTGHSVQFPARFVERLQEAPWLPGKDGQLHRPSELSLDDLDDHFSKNEMLERVLGMRPRTIDSLAKETGLDPQVLEYLRKNPGELNRLQRLMATERAKETVAGQLSEKNDSAGEVVRGDDTRESEDTDSRTARTQTRQTRLETRVYVEASSEPEFQKAQELGEQYWLYVVEGAEQDDFKIHRIQDPAHLVNQFFYDKGWKVLSEI